MPSQNLEQVQKIGIRLSQQQLRFVRMLELNTPELEEVVERELEDNPALGVKEETTEEDTRRYPTYTAPPRNDYAFTPEDRSETLYDQLLAQLSERRLSPRVETAARFIIGSLDSNGYLNRKLRDIIDDLAFGPGVEISEKEAREALDAVRSLDPPGIGANGLQDCLRIQLERMPKSETRDVALLIINKAYSAFTMKHRHRIMSTLKLPYYMVSGALNLILSLNPKPGAGLGYDPSEAANIIVPDFTINIEDGEITIALNNRIPELRIEQSFEQAMANVDRDFIRILSQRQQTMMTVMTAIASIQREYLLSEDVYRLKPMMIKNIADITGLDLSVISRVTSNKYVALPWGIFPLRFFFSDTIGEEKEGAEAATNRKIEAQITALIDGEDKNHPLSDREIQEEMQARGYDISRRTVAKYRDRQGIPVARLRKDLW